MDGFSIFGDYANEPAIELATRLQRLAPWARGKVFLGAGGGDVIEAAVKLARSYYAQSGQPTRQHVIGRARGYHGTHGLGTSIGGIPANQAGFGTLLERSSTVPHDDAAGLDDEIQRLGAENVATPPSAATPP